MAYLPFARPTIDEAMIAAVADTLRSRIIATGPRVAAFEEALSQRFGGRPVRTLTSATAAMQVALELLDIGPGDALAIMHPGAFEKLKAQGLPMQLLHSDPRRILVRKP